jgi:predicted Ser/Thr protein kinase
MTADPIRDTLVRALGVQYEIGRVIGRGGMGTVYLAHEKALDRDVAIKVLPPEAAESSPDGRERFRREARTAAQLTHSNIVPLYTFGETEGLSFFVMGYVRGESLGARLKREGRLAPDVAVRMLAELADALDYAHRKGVVHRDIKPDNVLIEDDSGRLMLTDFGIAKAGAAGTLTQTGVVIGTPTYMSPEQATGEKTVDGRSDLYSLGMLAYEMLAGRPAFSGENVQQILVQHVTQAPVPLRTLAPDTPVGLSALIMRLLEKDPVRRFADGKALRAALDAPDDSDEVLSPELRSVRSFVPLSFINYYLFALVALGIAVDEGILPLIKSAMLEWFSVIGVGSMVVGLAATAGIARWRGLNSWSEIWRNAVLAPRWWFVWWPRKWRPPSIADRLPPILTLWRKSFTAMVYVVLGVTVPAVIAGIFGPSHYTQALYSTALGAALTAELPFVVCGLLARRWGMKRGLPEQESTRLVSAPLSSAFWKRPNVAALLLSAPATAAAVREPNTPHEMLRAIGAFAQQLGTRFQQLTDDVLIGARDAINEIDALDRELATLAAEVSPAETARLDARLAELSDDSPLRALLTNQRELLRTLAARVDHLAQRRERVVDMVRTMWLQVANLRALHGADTSEASAITGRIRAICSSVAHEISADREVATLLMNADPSEG